MADRYDELANRLMCDAAMTTADDFAHALRIIARSERETVLQKAFLRIMTSLKLEAAQVEAVAVILKTLAKEDGRE